MEAFCIWLSPLSVMDIGPCRERSMHPVKAIDNLHSIVKNEKGTELFFLYKLPNMTDIKH
jgi:hypothetical protein